MILADNENFAALPWRTDEAAKKQYLENLAPIVFFTYNRPKHTIQTLEALKRNVLAENTRIYIFSDGPRNEKDKEKVEEIRKYLENLSGFKEVYLTKRENNVGLAANIVYGVTTLVEKYGKVIVIEDDILTTKYFLQYMNDALEIYKNDEQVMAVSSFAGFENKEGLPPTYFSKYFSCWGWATWQRAWQYFERNPEKQLKEYTPEKRKEIDWNGWDGIKANAEGKMNTWALFFDLAIAKQKGIVFYSKYDLCKNTGADGSGEHPATSVYYRGDMPDIEVKQFTLNIERCQLSEERWEKFAKDTNDYWIKEPRIMFSLDSGKSLFWRNNRGLKILNCLSRNTSWLVIGDGRSEMLSYLLKANGFKRTMPADIMDDCLKIAYRMDLINDYLVLNADKFEIPSERYDYVFCRDIYRITRQPYAMISEMLRVAKRGIVLIGLAEVENTNNISIKYEKDGAFVYNLSIRELIKLAISLNLPAICRYGYNDVYIPNSEIEPADEEKSPVFRYIKAEISKMDKRVLNGESDYNMLSVALFKKLPDSEEVEKLKRMGINFQELPKNPYMF